MIFCSVSPQDGVLDVRNATLLHTSHLIQSVLRSIGGFSSLLQELNLCHALFNKLILWVKAKV